MVQTQGKIDKVSRVSAVLGYSGTQYLSKSLCAIIFSECDFQEVGGKCGGRARKFNQVKGEFHMVTSTLIA